ncbi:MAG: Ig-like domain-containing protein [Clostridiales bacterium]|nr:MAG: Ig-like domain-containing protein [Clostridiales bacterium]
MFGKITLPTAKDGFTDDTGKVRIDGMYVFVNDENGAIENAFVKLNDDNTISITLPDETSIDYANRITVTVTDKDGNPQKDISVTVSDTMEKELDRQKLTKTEKWLCRRFRRILPTARVKQKVNGYNVFNYRRNKAYRKCFCYYR